MGSTNITQRGLINQGAFFSLYYLIDLLSPRLVEELDPGGREAHLKLLRRPFRNAHLCYPDSESTPGDIWCAWYSLLISQRLSWLLSYRCLPISYH